MIGCKRSKRASTQVRENTPAEQQPTHIGNVDRHDDDAKDKVSQISTLPQKKKRNEVPIAYESKKTTPLLTSLRSIKPFLSLKATKMRRNPAAPMNSEPSMKARCT